MNKIIFSVVMAIFLMLTNVTGQMLRQNTEIVVNIGPAIDCNDPNILIADVALADVCDAKLLKSNGVPSVSLVGRTWSAISDCNGWYKLTLTATDTNTEGTLDVVIQQSSKIKPMSARFDIIDANFGKPQVLLTAIAFLPTKSELSATDGNMLNYSRSVILDANGLDYVDSSEPNSDPNNWNFRAYMMYSSRRWSNETITDFTTGIFTTKYRNGNSWLNQPFEDSNNRQTIDRIDTP